MTDPQTASPLATAPAAGVTATDELPHELVVRLGAMDHRVVDAVRRFTIPRLPLASMGVAQEAVKSALATSQAVVLTGPRGVGKSFAVREIRKAFDHEQREALAHDASMHRIELSKSLDRLTGRTIRENLLRLLGEVSPVLAKERELGTRVADGDLEKRLASEMEKKNIRLLVVDEGQEAPDCAVEVVRRLITDAGARAKESIHGYPGVGVVLIGTPAFADRLRATDDINGRWSRFMKVEALQPEDVPGIYEAVFPGFQHAIARMGRPAWELVIEQLVRGRALTMRQVDNHCKLYFALLFEASLEGPPEHIIAERTTAPFDKRRFVYAFTQMDSEAPVPIVGERRMRRKRGHVAQ